MPSPSPSLTTLPPFSKAYGELPSKVSLREKPALSPAASANGLNVEPGEPPSAAQLIWLSR